MISRRGIIQGLISLVAAPAVIRVATLMPVKPIPDPFLIIKGTYPDGSPLIIRQWEMLAEPLRLMRGDEESRRIRMGLEKNGATIIWPERNTEMTVPPGESGSYHWSWWSI